MSSCECTGKFNVVVLYDHITSAGRAMAAYWHLTRELESEFMPDLRVWRIDVAASPECAAQADVEIAAAEMVIMAIHANQTFPPALLRWTEGAGDGRSPCHRALIAIIEAIDESALSAGPLNRILQSTAAQIHPDVFLWATPAHFGEVKPGSREDAVNSAIVRATAAV
jgi:hypothetical protein